MNVDELTLGQIKEIQSLCGPEKNVRCPYDIGKNYFIRTVTMILTGKLVGVTDQELVLEQAAWIADTGRYHNALQTGEFDEVEPYPDDVKVIVGRGSIIDACEFQKLLPRTVK